MAPCAGPARLAAALLALAGGACGTDAREGDKILAAIDRLQEVPARDHASRKRVAAEVLAIEVRTAGAVKARDACGQGYLKLAESNELSEGIQAEMSDTQKKSDPADLMKRLQQADLLIQEAEPLLEACKVARSELATAGR